MKKKKKGEMHDKHIYIASKLNSIGTMHTTRDANPSSSASGAETERIEQTVKISRAGTKEEEEVKTEGGTGASLRRPSWTVASLTRMARVPSMTPL
jgi:hypothetical protein